MKLTDEIRLSDWTEEQRRRFALRLAAELIAQAEMESQLRAMCDAVDLMGGTDE